jgi:hypothetical protein
MPGDRPWLKTDLSTVLQKPGSHLIILQTISREALVEPSKLVKDRDGTARIREGDLIETHDRAAGATSAIPDIRVTPEVIFLQLVPGSKSRSFRGSAHYDHSIPSSMTSPVTSDQPLCGD